MFGRQDTVDKLKWGLGGGFGIILIGRFAYLTGLVDNVQTIPFSAGGSALILWALMGLLFGENIEGGPAEFPRRSGGSPSEAPQPEKPSTVHVPDMPGRKPGQKVDVSSTASSSSLMPSGEQKKAEGLAPCPAGRLVPLEDFFGPAIIMMEAERIVQRWMEADPRPSFGPFVNEQGFFLLVSPYLSPALQARLVAPAEHRLLSDEAEADLVRSYVAEVARLSNRWGVPPTEPQKQPPAD